MSIVHYIMRRFFTFQLVRILYERYVCDFANFTCYCDCGPCVGTKVKPESSTTPRKGFWGSFRDCVFDTQQFHECVSFIEHVVLLPFVRPRVVHGLLLLIISVRTSRIQLFVFVLLVGLVFSVVVVALQVWPKTCIAVLPCMPV